MEDMNVLSLRQIRKKEKEKQKKKVSGIYISYIICLCKDLKNN